MNLRMITVLLLLLGMPCICSAQRDPIEFSHLDISNGLSNNQVNCILKDGSGFMWFGTSSGLNRYDGYRFKVFKHLSRDSNSLSDNNVMHLFEGPEKRMWVATHKISEFIIQKQKSSRTIPRRSLHATT